MLDAGDVYTAGLNYDMIPILSEVYNLGKPEYYVVAVVKARDADTELIYLKNKNTCHTGTTFITDKITCLSFYFYFFLIYMCISPENSYQT